jgi:chromosome segregation ATPase
MIDRQQRRLEELITANATEKQRSLTLEKNLKEEQQKHTEQTTTIRTLETELDRAKTELTITKSELAITKSELAETKDALTKLRNEQAITSRLLAEEQGKRIAMELVVTGLQAKVDQLLAKVPSIIPPGFEADQPSAEL